MGSFNKGARQRARRLAMQALYQWHIAAADLSDIELQFQQDHDFSRVDKAYFQELLHQLPAQLQTIDTLYQPFLDRELNELNPVELAVIRIGTYELSQRLDVPYRVVINEALELAKKFGSEDGHKYVNGVLDRVAKQCRAAEIQSS